MMARSVVFALGALSLSTAAKAQDSQAVTGWDAKVNFELGIRIGENLPDDADPDLIDESELGASVSFKRKSANGLVPLEFKFGVTDSPGLVAEVDPESSFFGRVTLGDAYIPFKELTLENDRSVKASRVTDAFRPYAYYQYSSKHEGLLDSRTREDHEAAVGFRLRDVRTIMSTRKMLGTAVEIGAASDEPGFYWEAGAQLANVWSTNPEKERFIPQAKLTGYSPLFRRMRFFGAGQIDHSIYRSALSQSGEDRKDTRLRLTAGVDLSAAMEDWGDVSLVIAGQFQRQWSNEPTVESSRAYFMPSASIAVAF